MKLYVYETESMAGMGGPDLAVIAAESRAAADQVILKDYPNFGIMDQKHLENVFKVEEKPLVAETVVVHANIFEHYDPHEYTK